MTKEEAKDRMLEIDKELIVAGIRSEEIETSWTPRGMQRELENNEWCELQDEMERIKNEYNELESFYNS